MVSFQRMKDEIDGWGNTITSRVPVISKSGCLTIVAITVFLLVIIGFAIGYGSRYITILSGVIRKFLIECDQLSAFLSMFLEW